MAQSAANSVDNSPLTSEELRQVLFNLYELNSCKEQLSLYEQFVASEKEVREKLLDAERQNTAVAQKERDVAQKEADMYKSLYESIKKKKAGFGCWMGRIFSFGVYRCPK